MPTPPRRPNQSNENYRRMLEKGKWRRSPSQNRNGASESRNKNRSPRQNRNGNTKNWSVIFNMFGKNLTSQLTPFNLARLASTSKEMSRLLKPVVQKQRKEYINRIKARIDNPMFRYVEVPEYKRQSAMRIAKRAGMPSHWNPKSIGLHPTVGIQNEMEFSPYMGEHIRRYVNRTKFGVLHPNIKEIYRRWALEHNEGKPYIPNERNKEQVALALLRGFRLRKQRRATSSSTSRNK